MADPRASDAIKPSPRRANRPNVKRLASLAQMVRLSRRWCAINSTKTGFGACRSRGWAFKKPARSCRRTPRRIHRSILQEPSDNGASNEDNYSTLYCISFRYQVRDLSRKVRNCMGKVKTHMCSAISGHYFHAACGCPNSGQKNASPQNPILTHSHDLQEKNRHLRLRRDSRQAPAATRAAAPSVTVVSTCDTNVKPPLMILL